MKRLARFIVVPTFELNKVAFDPLANHLVFDVHVTSTCGWFLCHGHRSAGIIVFI